MEIRISGVPSLKWQKQTNCVYISKHSTPSILSSFSWIESICVTNKVLSSQIESNTVMHRDHVDLNLWHSTCPNIRVKRCILTIFNISREIRRLQVHILWELIHIILRKCDRWTPLIRFCTNSCSFCLMKNTVNVLKIWTPFLFLQNACNCSCSPRTDIVKVVPWGSIYSNDWQFETAILS